MLLKRNSLRSAMLLVSGLLFTQSVFADVAIVVHPSNSISLDKKTISKLYMGKKSKFSNGRVALALNAPAGSPIRDEFNQKVIGRSSQKVNAYWSKLIFTGKGIPPKELGSDAEVLATVAANPDAIGYVDAANVTDTVKVIATF